MSREKQIEVMAKDLCQNTFCSFEERNKCKLKVGEYCANCRCMAERLYNAGYRKQEWISVEDRLPEIEGDARTWGELKIQKSVRVLCACKQKSGKVFVKEGYCELWGSRVVWKIPGTVDSVTHWMPLPEAPKMKGGEE